MSINYDKYSNNVSKRNDTLLNYRIFLNICYTGQAPIIAPDRKDLPGLKEEFHVVKAKHLKTVPCQE